ncbi:unknown [Dialister sp. CAG:357]|nr:unknown [Dialister sp. CAG:357]
MEKCLPQQGLQEAEKGLKTTLFKYTAKQSHLFYFGRILLHPIPYGFIRDFLN